MSDGDNRYNNPEDKEKFREGYREIFKDRKSGVNTGKWVLTPEGLVPYDQHQKTKAKQLIRVRDKSTEFVVERVAKDMNHSTRTEGGYRSI